MYFINKNQVYAQAQIGQVQCQDCTTRHLAKTVTGAMTCTEKTEMSGSKKHYFYK